MTFFGTWGRCVGMGAAIALASLPALAGTQIEERLAPSVVTVMSGAISDHPVPAGYATRPDLRRDSIRSSSSASSSTRVRFASTRSRVPARAATCR